MSSASFDLNDLKRRMQASIASLKHELGGLRTGRASASLVEPLHVEAYGQSMPMNQVATISIPEARMISIQVWDKGMVAAVDKAIRVSNLGLSPTIEGQILRIDRVTLKVSDKTTLKGSFPIAMTSDGNDVWVSALGGFTQIRRQHGIGGDPIQLAAVVKQVQLA